MPQSDRLRSCPSKPRLKSPACSVACSRRGVAPIEGTHLRHPLWTGSHPDPVAAAAGTAGSGGTDVAAARSGWKARLGEPVSTAIDTCETTADPDDHRRGPEPRPSHGRRLAEDRALLHRRHRRLLRAGDGCPARCGPHLMRGPAGIGTWLTGGRPCSACHSDAFAPHATRKRRSRDARPRRAVPVARHPLPRVIGLPGVSRAQVYLHHAGSVVAGVVVVQGKPGAGWVFGSAQHGQRRHGTATQGAPASGLPSTTDTSSLRGR